VHLFDFLQQSFASLFVMIQASAQLNPEPISPAEMANRLSGKLIQPAGIAKTLLSEICLKVRGLDFISPRTLLNVLFVVSTSAVIFCVGERVCIFNAVKKVTAG